ncbi:hypothetical protein PRIPAC_70450 [Pristionchus pacificus]|uniref:Uncharacterized protein n=1 Tax=Pristionchus pacificus TaxID=54126 RepID=A0A2A6CT13_PRIPA|nr:hypothetical protein PRIPAC_70450 [Pristionchus pacificus]|eukprot:PDM81226.1 hypothetical protein PRIPAC_36229 [Pristionchus pacificus]
MGDILTEARKKSAGRPAMQIYRPPGLRSDGSPVSAPTLPSPPSSQLPPSAGKQNSNDEKKKERNTVERGERRRSGEEVNNNTSSSSTRPSPPPSLLATTIPPPPQYTKNGAASAVFCTLTPPSSGLVSPSSPFNTSNGCTSIESARPRAASTMSEESMKSGVSSSIGSETKEKKQKTPPVMKKKEEKRRQLTPQEMLHAGVTLRALSINHCVDELEKLIASEFSDEVAGAAVGQALVTHAVETTTSSSRAVAKAANLLKDSACFPGIHRGFVLGLTTYNADRDSLRQEKFRSWLTVLSLSSDLFANVGDNEQGDLVSLVFDIFGFLLRAPVLENVKIEELENLISSLLSIGYELERECPDRLAELKDLIRDAFIEVSEPWARKMILLMLELSASDWKLPPEANEYYFHQTTN